MKNSQSNQYGEDMIRRIRKRLNRKNEKKIMETIIVILLSTFITFIAFYSMRLGRFVSLIIFALGFIPILIAYFLKIDLKKMLPYIRYHRQPDTYNTHYNRG